MKMNVTQRRDRSKAASLIQACFSLSCIGRLFADKNSVPFISFIQKQEKECRNELQF
ncbi:hypothetical protein [Dysosmobacter sp.]|uniref:hypothetical protein n=1 Tax=Dysosmobacter sp. TaxID=2591382 RepID=UPI002A8DC5F7|nr:hypothetical protein [Dysosmobacter sp.]MDY3986171.1 hypothetical protein [Dysosmobacter sp.]